MQLSKKEKLVTGLVAAVAVGYSYVPSQIGKVANRYRRKKTNKSVYLTFDDGPDPVYTEKLLDLLKAYNIKASFFVVAQFAEENPFLVNRMRAEGHLIGLHSLKHKSAMIQTPKYTNMEFAKSMEIMETLGVKAKYYRPPWGHVNLVTLKNLKKHSLSKVLWDVMAQDWRKDITVDEIQYKLLKRTTAGDIICLHDGRGVNDAPAKMIEALEKTIPIWLEEGYQFRKIDEIRQ